MKQRCNYAKTPGYENYGGRGITVCQKWLTSFEAFYQDMGPRPSDKHSLDRIDTNGHYEPGNCRWATWGEQQNNTRHNVRLTFRGETLTAAQWAARTGMSAFTIYARVERGWPVERILTTKPRTEWKKRGPVSAEHSRALSEGQRKRWAAYAAAKKAG
jgi:hypothetical protein